MEGRGGGNDTRNDDAERATPWIGDGFSAVQERIIRESAKIDWTNLKGQPLVVTLTHENELRGETHKARSQRIETGRTTLGEVLGELVKHTMRRGDLWTIVAGDEDNDR